ncbi:MAG: hypothetical protein KDA79_06985 [Planctomycetaceae bacterium]|nr:hypothetical protein [Planctomycetaceae bacterium]
MLSGTAAAQGRYPLPYPPSLPDGQKIVRDRSPEFLEPGENLKDGVEIAQTAPLVEGLYYPGQTYSGNPWCFRGVSTVRGSVYYSALCDHLAPLGTAKLFAFDQKDHSFRQLVDTAAFLREAGQIPPGMNYTPGEVQTRIEFGKDGWLYYGTTRGSTRVTNDANGYKGDWVLRTHPESGETEVVYAFPVEKHCILASVLDPERMMFYGGTAAGDYRDKTVKFFALDLTSRKVIHEADGGFDRYAIFARSTGRVYWEGKKWDPETRTITAGEAPHVRSATAETPQGVVYGTTHREARLWGFDTKTEKLTDIGEGAVASQTYISSMHADPTGRYLYYVPGAHGGAVKDGSPVVQYDLKRKKRKVIAFLHSLYSRKYGYHPDGCFVSVLSPEGDKLYVSWDGWRTGQPRGWESCMLTVIHIPESERLP